MNKSVIKFAGGEREKTNRKAALCPQPVKLVRAVFGTKKQTKQTKEKNRRRKNHLDKILVESEQLS